MKWCFPEGASIPAGGYYLVYCSGKDKMQQNGIPHTNFRISAERETLVLSDAGGHLLDRVTIENVPVDCSVGRDSSGNLVQFVLTTPGQSNDANGQAKADELIRAIRLSDEQRGRLHAQKYWKIKESKPIRGAEKRAFSNRFHPVFGKRRSVGF